MAEQNSIVDIFNNLSLEVGEWSRSKGFREDWEDSYWLEDMVELDGCLDSKSHDKLRAIAEVLRANVIGTKIALVVSEMSELLKRLREIGAAEALQGDANIAEEIADTHIRLFDLANMIGADVGTALGDKMKVNENRPYKHGKKF